MTACYKSFSYLSDEWRAVLGIVNTAVAFIAFLGNLVAMMIIFRTKYFRNLSACFLGSLVMTDFLVGILLAPMHVAQLVSEPLRNDCTLNNARRYPSTLLIGASVSSVALISYDRYLHLTRTQNYRQFMNKRKVTILITVGWVLPIGVPMLKVIAVTAVIYNGIAFAYVCICFVVIVACYACIIKTVRKKEKELIERQAQDQVQQHRITNEIRAAKIIATIIVCYVMTFFPSCTYFCVVAIEAFLPNGMPGLKETSTEVYYAVVLTLAMANSGMNPFIYYFRNPKFKESLAKSWRRFCSYGRQNNSLRNETPGGDTVSKKTFQKSVH